jgi:hypothetical protein
MQRAKKVKGELGDNIVKAGPPHFETFWDSVCGA